MQLPLTSTPNPGLPPGAPAHHAIGIGLGFGLLFLLFATVLGLMILAGHLRHRRRDRR